MDDPDSVDRAYEEAMKAKKHAIEQGRIISNTNEHLQVVDSWKNIAPILDAELVDLDGNGQVCVTAGICVISVLIKD